MKKLTAFTLSSIFLVGLLWFGADFWSRYLLAEACDDWPFIDGALSEHSPSTSVDSVNSTVAEIMAAAEDLNSFAIDIEDLDGYEGAQLAKPDGTVETPHSEIQLFFARNEKVLSRIVSILVHVELPKWPFYMERYADMDQSSGGAPGSPDLDLQSFRNLNTLLVCQALVLRSQEEGRQA